MMRKIGEILMLNIRIENFEGPLDLLVHLVNTKKMDVKNIIISQIIDDYLQIIDEYKENNFKLKVEFLEMASQLLEIKAYSILRKDEKNIQEEELEKELLSINIFKNYQKYYQIENKNIMFHIKEIMVRIMI